MRVVGGEWRGRKIEEPRGRETTRPTTDRVREAMASMILSALNVDMDEASVLDAFAGSGALGIEMLSRGAAHLTSFDIDRNAVQLVRRNLESFKCDRSRYVVMQGDVLKQVERGRVMGAPFDLVLLDPPYAFGLEPVCELLGNLRAHGLLNEGAIAVFEHSADIAEAEVPGFSLEKHKRYGITAVDLLRLETTHTEDDLD